MCPLGWTRNCCKRKKKIPLKPQKLVFFAKITIFHSLLTTCAKSIEINANIFNFREFGGRVFLSAVMYIYMTVVKGKQKLYFITHYPSVPRLQCLFLILLCSWNLNYHIRGSGGWGGGLGIIQSKKNNNNIMIRHLNNIFISSYAEQALFYRNICWQ